MTAAGDSRKSRRVFRGFVGSKTQEHCRGTERTLGRDLRSAGALYGAELLPAPSAGCGILHIIHGVGPYPQFPTFLVYITHIIRTTACAFRAAPGVFSPKGLPSGVSISARTQSPRRQLHARDFWRRDPRGPQGSNRHRFPGAGTSRRLTSNYFRSDFRKAEWHFE